VTDIRQYLAKLFFYTIVTLEAADG